MKVGSLFSGIGERVDTPCQLIYNPTMAKLTSEQKSQAVVMYDKGLSVGEIAAFYNVTRQGMWGILTKRTTLRPQKRYGTDNHFHRGGKTASDASQNLAEKAMEKKILVKPDVCENCGGPGKSFKDGRTPIQAHHDDYNKPLEVRWLCQPCHHKWHRENKAIKKVSR